MTYKLTLPPIKSSQEQLLGADLALVDGDLVIAPTGDYKVVQGYDNLEQTVKNLLSLVPGELPMHPQRGLVREPGVKATPDNLLLYKTAVRQALTADPRIQAVRQLQVPVEGDVVRIQGYVITATRAQPFALDTRGGT